MNKLYIITGPAGVGKSSVSKMLANKLNKSVLIEGDDIYNQFVGGRISPWKENAPIDLFWKNCILLINNYLKNGYDVVFNYIIKKKDIKLLKQKFGNYNIKFVVLLTNEDILIERDKERPLDCQMGERSLILLNEFKDELFDEDNIIDTSKLTIKETVDDIINNEKYLKKNGIDNMKYLELVIPKLNEYKYEQKLLSNQATMNYNAGYDVSYEGYHYDTGCIDFPKSKWEKDYIKRQEENRFFAYIKDNEINKYVGYVNYHYNINDNIYECGIVIEDKYRGKGYSKIGLKLLCNEAFKSNIDKLYDTFEKERKNTLRLFESVGFKIVKELTWKKFNKDVLGVIVCLKKEDYNDNLL